MSIIRNSLCSHDVTILQNQLNRQEISAVAILRRCPHGQPALVLLNPSPEEHEYQSGHINFMALSTLLWLTCPHLNERIHSLESRGYVDKISRFILSDRGLLSRMMDAHASFYFLRKRVYHQFVGHITSLEENRKLLCTGIGGIRDAGNIRCLHMHYAHYLLCPDNPVGRVIESLLEGETCCEKGQCGTDSPQNGDHNCETSEKGRVTGQGDS